MQATRHKAVKELCLERAIVWPETWTLRKEEERRLQALQMYIWRIIARISWNDRLTNEEVLGKVAAKRGVLDIMKDRKRK